MNLKKTQKCPRRPTIFELCSLRRSFVQNESEADNSHLREAKRSRSRARPDLSGQATTKVRISHHRSLRLAIAVAHEGRNKSISVQVARHLFSMNAPRSAFTTLSTRNLCLQYPTSPPKKMGGHNHRTVFNLPH